MTSRGSSRPMTLLDTQSIRALSTSATDAELARSARTLLPLALDQIDELVQILVRTRDHVVVSVLVTEAGTQIGDECRELLRQLEVAINYKPRTRGGESRR